VVTVVMNESDEVKYNLCIGTKATEVVILPRNPNISLLTSFFTLFFLGAIGVL
jgi:hypothetical protein